LHSVLTDGGDETACDGIGLRLIDSVGFGNLAAGIAGHMLLGTHPEKCNRIGMELLLGKWSDCATVVLANAQRIRGELPDQQVGRDRALAGRLLEKIWNVQASAFVANVARPLQVHRERRPPFSPDDVVLEFVAVLKSYRVREVTGDRFGGEWPRERFRVHGIKYNVAEKPKSDIYRDALPILNSNRAELLDVPRLSSQLCRLERRVSRAGRDSIDHPPGAHDDTANAVCGVLVTATSAPQPMRITDAALRRLSIPSVPAAFLQPSFTNRLRY
jgi:hypothetical protein